MSEVTFRFRGDSRGAVDASRSTERALKNVERAAERTASQLGRSPNMRGYVGGINSALGGVERRVAGFSRNVLGTLTRVGVRAGLVLGGIGVAAGGMATALGLHFYKTQQSATTAFTVILGDGAKAQKFIGEIADFAAKTPFEFPGLVRTAQLLLNAGFAAEQVIPLMTRVGDAVAAAGGDPEIMERTVRSLTQVQAKGRLMAEEMLQLSETGTFGWRDLARELGTTVPQAQELVTKGMVSADAALEAFQRNAARRFPNMMREQSKTLAGTFSTFKDTFSAIASRVLTPFFVAATRTMKRVSDYFETDAGKRMIVTAERVGASIASSIGSGLRRLIGWLIRNREEIVATTRQFVGFAVSAATALVRIVGAANRVAQALGGWKEVLIGLGIAWVGLRATTMAYFIATQMASKTTAAVMKRALISTGIGAIVVALGLAAELMIRHWDEVKDGVRRVGNSIARHWQGIWNTMKAQALEAFLKIIEPFSKLPSRMGGWAKRAKNNAIAQLEQIKIDQRIWAKGGTDAGNAFAMAFYNASSPTVQAAMAGQNPDGTAVTGSSGDRLTGAGTTGTLTGDLAGVKPGILAFGQKVAAFSGGSLNSMSGFRRDSKIEGTNRVSYHASGNAIDLGPYYGKTLISVGQAALMAAGMPRAKAMTYTTYYGSLNGYEIIFNCNPCGGDHTDHVHIGASPAVRATPPKPTPAEVPTLVPETPIELGAGKETKPKAKAKKLSFDAIPDRLETQLLEAEVAENLPRQLKVLDLIENNLKAQLRKVTDIKKRKAILTALKTVKGKREKLENSVEFDAIPDKVELELLIAETTNNVPKQLAILRKIEDGIERRIKKTTDVKKLIRLWEELASTRGRIASLRPEQVAEALVPRAHRVALVRAETTAQQEDDIKALDAIIAGLNRKLAKVRKLKATAANLDREIEIRGEITTATGQRASLIAGTRDVEQATSSLERYEGIITRLPASLLTKLGPLMDRVRKLLTGVVTSVDLAAIQESFSQIEEIAGAAMQRLEEVVREKRASLGDAFGRVTERAMRVFDAATERLIRNARARVEEFGFDIGEGGETPAERALRERAEARQVDTRAAQLKELQARLEDLSGRSFTTVKDYEDQQEEIARIRKDIDEQLYDSETSRLEALAREERRAADTALERQRQQIRDERELLRERFSDRLADIREQYDREEISAQEANDRMMGVFREFGADYEAAGQELGTAFAEGFADALQRVVAAIKAVADAIEAAASTGGGAAGAAAASAADDFQAWVDERAAFYQANPRYFTSSGPNRPRQNVIPGAPLQAFATGGIVRGSASAPIDSVLARVTPGELILNRAQQRAVAEQLLARNPSGVNLTAVFHGNVLAERDIMESLRDEMLRLGRRQGSGAGSIFGGRA